MFRSVPIALVALWIAGCSQRAAVSEPSREPVATGAAAQPACESLPLWHCVEWAGCVSLDTGTNELLGATEPRLCDQLLPSNQPTGTSREVDGRHVRFALPACEESATVHLSGMPSCPPCAEVPLCSRASAN